jgi:hypothetical protein
MAWDAQQKARLARLIGLIGPEVFVSWLEATLTSAQQDGLAKGLRARWNEAIDAQIAGLAAQKDSA